MTKLNFHYYPRDFEAGNLIENFMVSAVVNILFWRFFLHTTGYPKILFGNFYIPHVLIGGALMTIALIMLFSFLNREIKYIAAIVGGAGFGLFVDEIGKYITQDNNYFYQPAVAIMYVIFVFIFLGSRIFEKYFKPTSQEYVINALELTKQVIMHDLDTEEKKQALYLLEKSNNNDVISKYLKKSLEETRAKSLEPHVFHNLRNWLKERYFILIRHPSFTKLTISFFIILSLISFFQSLFNLYSAQGFSEWGQTIFSLLSGLIVLIGVYTLLYGRVYEGVRKRAYEMFKYSILISIFLTQFFRFLQSEFSAIAGFAINLVILSVLQYMIFEEENMTNKDNN